MADVRIILFDFGGVLLHLNDPAATFGIDGQLADFSRGWLMSPAVRAHECGQIDAAEFGHRIVEEMQLPYSAAEFVARFDRWPDTISDATVELVRRIPASYTCAILSNTNARHWSAFDIDGTFGGRIDRCFLSFENERIKPEAGAFRQVIEAYDAVPGAVLFIDDNPINIAAAADAGMRTRLCAGVTALPDILADEGII